MTIQANSPHGQETTRTGWCAWFTQSRDVLVLLWALYIIPRVLILLIPTTPTSDADFYFKQAQNLANGLGYITSTGDLTAFWPPGWPMAMSGVVYLFGPSVLAVGLFNLFCSILSAWFVLALGRKLFDSEAVARCGLLLLAIYPNNIGYVALALTEVFYTTLLLGICWLLVVRRSLIAYVVAGLLLGVATLVKAQTLAVVPIILAIDLLRMPSFWKRIPSSLLKFVGLIALAACVVAPWSIRNYRVFDAVVPVSTNGGFTLLTGNNDVATGDYTPGAPVVVALDARKLGEVERDKEAKRLGLEWIKTHPGEFIKLVPYKLFRLWGPDGEADWGFQGGYANYQQHAETFFAVRLFNQAYYVVLILSFAVAAPLMIVLRRRQGQHLIDWWLLPYGIALYPTAIAVVFSGQSRFHYPVMPFICMTAGWLLVTLFCRNQMGNDHPFKNVSTSA